MIMKIAYLGKIQLSDVDLSYLNAAEKKCDITYFMEVTPRFTKGPAYNIDKVYPKSGIFKAVDIYPEIANLSGFINTDKFYIVNTSGRLWQIKAFFTNFLLLIFLIKNKFDVIHVTWPLNIYEFILYLLKKKMILTVHDPFPHTGLDTFIVRLRRKFAFTFIRKFIILNKNQRQKFLDYYHLNGKNVIDSRLSRYTYLQTVKPIKDENLENNKYILFFGKISKYKGLDYLLPAMCEIHKSNPGIKLIVAGGGRFDFDISQYKSKDFIEIRNRFIPDNEMVALIKNCLFVVCPYTDATQSGVVMSAFAFNKPVVATNVGGLPEMVTDKKFGLIIKEKNIDAITDAVNQLINNPDEITEYSQNIKNAYEKGSLSWEHEADSLINEYKCLSGRH